MQKKSGLPIKTRHALILAGIIAGSFLFAHLLVLFFSTLFGIWNHQINDHLFLLRYTIKGKEPVSPDIVHIALTNRGIEELDIPIWNRKIFGRIISMLNKVDVGAIVCDFMFQDPGIESDDTILIRAAGESGKLYFPVIFQPEEYTKISRSGRLDQKSIELFEKDLWPLHVKRKGNPPGSGDVILPFYRLLKNATGTGHINLLPDPDGKNRRMPLVYTYKDTYIPALILRVIADVYQVESANVSIVFGRHIRLRDARISGKMKKDLFIPIDRQGAILLNFAGPWQDSFFHFPLQNILNAETDAELFSHLYDVMENSIVVISDISSRNKDYGPGIFHSVYPLSGLHLTLANMILKQRYLHKPGFLENSVIALVLAVSLFLFSLRLKYRSFYCVSLLFLFLYILCEIGLFLFSNRLSSMLAPCAGFLLACAGISIYRLFVGEVEKRSLQADVAARVKLEQVKKRFFEDITHQMRTPLTLILTPLKSLMTNLQKAGPVYMKHNLDLMKQNAEKLLQAVNEILDIAKMDAGKLKLQAEKADIVSLLDRLIYSFNALKRKKQIEVKFKTNSPQLFLYINPGMIEKVFSNLLSNAFRFTEPGGKITVQIHSPVILPDNLEKKKSSIPLSFAEIRIKDTGPGIPESELPFVFDRFHQTASTGESTQTGSSMGSSTGVGLSIVKDYVEFHKGMVDVRSTPGKGTEFIVVLPVGKDHLDPLEIIDTKINREHEKTKDIKQQDKINTPQGNNKPGKTKVQHIPVTGGFLFPGKPVLLVDDEPELLTAYKQALQPGGVTNIILCHESGEVMNILKSRNVSVVALDLAMPGKTGDELLPLMKQQYPEIPVIITTGIRTIESAVQCIKAGAYDYMVKPVEIHKLISHIKHCIEKQDLKDEVVRLTETFTLKGLKHPGAFSGIVTQDQQMLTLFKYIEAIAESPVPVLITGESGVGKELIARAVHNVRKEKGKFIAVNTAGIDKAMFLDTLFGHKKGAYTGADSERKGLIEEAKEGTLFLDEIGDLDMSVQVKLLRFLEEQTYRPLGSDMELQACVKIIAATNADMETKLNTGKLRKDLYYRFAQHKITIPPLRERLDDLPLLIKHFTEQKAKQLNKKIPAYPEKCIPLLKTYHFPGNIRQLEAMISDVVTITESELLPFSYFKEYIRKHSPAGEIKESEKGGKEKSITYSGEFPSLEEIETFFITEAMKKAGGIQSNAARLLGISKYALHRLLKKKSK